MLNQIDRNDYSIPASETAQANFETIASTLESALERRDQDVQRAMAEYEATGVSEEYRALEQQWNRVGAEVRTIITAIRTSLQDNDDTARRALQGARAAIPG